MNPPKSRILPAACLWFLTLLTLSVKAQPTTQDCLGAVPVCSPTLTSSGIITGTGNIPNEINPINSCMLTGERNDTWYLIGIGSSGLLRFSIVPNNLTENYNWALFDLTNSPCSAIFTNPALEVECNYSNTAGVTGANGQPGPQNHSPIPVTPGQILVLNVSAFSSINQSGYTLDFSATTTGVIDNTPPSITSVSAMNCGATSIGVTFNEMIDCASVLPAGLQLTGPGGPYTVTAVTAPNCSGGGDFSKSFTVSFSPALVTAGTYTLSLINPVTDVCGNPTSMPQSFSFPVAAMNVSFNQTNVTCFGGNNGSLTANVTGSGGPFTYQWAPSGGSNATAQFLTAGTYTLTVTNSGGCSVSASTTITQPLTGLTATSVVTPANGCAANGTATVTVSNGQPPFTYNWWPTGGTGPTASGLTAGGYMVTITDANQCALNYFLNIPSSNGPAASIVSSTDVSCHGGNDGTATVAVTGATGPFGYSWSPSGGTSATASGLTAGNYTVTVTVNATCILTATVVIVEPPTPLSLTSSFISTSCGNNNGSITINASGSVPPYTYSWTPTVSAGSSASGLSSGNYAVTVSDANGCTQTASFTIAASTALSLSLVNHSNITCNGSANGSTGVSVSGGQPPYSYQWSSGQTTSTISGLNVGTYIVTVTDASGCAATLTDVITQPAALTITAPVVQHVLCFGNATGSVSFTASGGQSPLTWQWSGGASSGSSATGLTAGTYSVTVTDANGCSVSGSAVVNQPTAPLSVQASITNTICGNSNGVISLSTSGGTGPYVYVWNNGTSSASLTGLGAGLYTVTVTDAQGCSLTDTYALQASGAPQLTLVSLTDVSCHGGNNGSAVLSANGGVQPYTWSWSGGVSSSSSATGLQAGSYAVTVTDATGCQSVQQLNIFEPNPLQVTVNGTSSVCQGSQAAISAAVQGGTPPYQYQWNTGAVSQSVTVMPSAASAYTVTVTDANGCTSAPQTFTVNVADPLSMNISAPDTVCQGLTATINVIASGGDGNYVYTWSNGMSGASNTILVNSPVLLTVTVSDGCSSPAVQQQVQVAMVSPPVISVALSPQKGCDPFTAAFTLPGTPMPGVTYQWDFGDGTSATGTQLNHTYSGHGSYQVMLTAWSTASPACSTTVNAGGSVTVLPQPEARFEYSPSVPTVSRPEVRFDDRSTYASSWRWNFGDQSPEETIPDPVHIYRSAGVFKVRLDVTSADGCADSVYRDVEVVEDMVYFIPNAFTADENGINDQFQIFGVGFDSYEITIFDRWGKRIHQSKNGANPWDGKDMETGKQVPQGMYICKIVMTDKLGKSVTRFTHVTLLR